MGCVPVLSSALVSLVLVAFMEMHQPLLVSAATSAPYRVLVSGEPQIAGPASIVNLFDNMRILQTFVADRTGTLSSLEVYVGSFESGQAQQFNVDLMDAQDRTLVTTTAARQGGVDDGWFKVIVPSQGANVVLEQNQQYKIWVRCSGGTQCRVYQFSSESVYEFGSSLTVMGQIVAPSAGDLAFSVNYVFDPPCDPEHLYRPLGQQDCVLKSICQPGSYVGNAGSSTLDKTCRSCPDGSMSDSFDADGCRGWNRCGASEYEIKAGTSTSDTECANLRVCSGSEFEQTAPTPTTNRVCRPLTRCLVDEYERQEPTQTSDRQCRSCHDSCVGPCTGPLSSSCIKCNPDRFMSLLTYDHECVTSCPSGTFPNESNRLCETCKSPCSQCFRTATTCLACVSGYELNTADETCEPICDTGQFYSSGSCFDCPPSCSECISSTFCTSCIQGYEAVTGACVPECSNNEQLVTIDDEQVCLPICDEDDSIEPLNGGNYRCRECGSGHYLDPNKLNIGPCNDFECSPGTTDHDSDPTTACVTCAPGHYLDASFVHVGSCAAFACGDSSTDHDKDTSTPCVECSPGHYLPRDDLHTLPCRSYKCPDGSTDHDSDPSTQCVTCGAGHYLDPSSLHKGACSQFQCDGDSTDDDKDPTTPCVSCGEGHFFPSNAARDEPCSVYRCPAGSTDHDSDPNTACQNCARGHYVPGSLPPTGACSNYVCAAGTTDDDSDAATPCVTCGPGQYVPAGSYGSCEQLACAAGFTDHDSNPATPCQRCNGGRYVPPGSSGSCNKYRCVEGEDDDQDASTPCKCDSGHVTADGYTCVVACGSAEQYYDTEERECRPCTSCAPGQYEASACTLSSNRECGTCTKCTLGLEYASRSCSQSSDAICTTCRSPCSAGFYESTPCTVSSNRQCSRCSACGTDEYVDTLCTDNADTVCKPCRKTCPAGQYLSKQCTPDSDIECSPCKICSSNEYETTPCTTFSDRECAACKSCDLGLTYEIEPCQKAADRVCDTCTSCKPGVTFETASCTAQLDRACAPCSACPAGKFEDQRCTITRDRTCTECRSACSDGLVEIVRCTQSTDRVCGLPSDTTTSEGQVTGSNTTPAGAGGGGGGTSNGGGPPGTSDNDNTDAGGSGGNGGDAGSGDGDGNGNPSQSSGSPDVATVAGAAAGGVVVLVCIFVMVGVMLRRSRQDPYSGSAVAPYKGDAGASSHVNAAYNPSAGVDGIGPFYDRLDRSSQFFQQPRAPDGQQTYDALGGGTAHAHSAQESVYNSLAGTPAASNRSSRHGISSGEEYSTLHQHAEGNPSNAYDTTFSAWSGHHGPPPQLDEQMYADPTDDFGMGSSDTDDVAYDHLDQAATGMVVNPLHARSKPRLSAFTDA